LRTLRLEGNMIAKVESFQNKEKLTHFLFDKNPLYDRITRVFGSTNPQNMKEFIQMPNKEILEEEKRLTEKARHERLIQKQTYKKNKKQKTKKSNNKSAVGMLLVIIGVITLIISGCYLLAALVIFWLGGPASIADIVVLIVLMIFEGVVALIGYILVRTNS